MMRKTTEILLLAALIVILAFLAVSCSGSGIKYSDIDKIDVDERLRSEDFTGFPLETFDISQITLVIKYKDTVDENGATITGETITKQAEDYMLKAEDREKLKTAGTKSITLICYGYEITFPLKLYSEISEKYTVAFYAEDGVTQLGKTQRVAEGGRAEQPTVPGKEGYTFIGWIDIDTGKSSTFDNVRKNLRLKALYEPNEVSVGYYYVDGDEEVVILETKIAYGESGEDYFPEPPVREGYEFVKWRKESEGKFYAEYEEVKYQIKFVYRKYINGNYIDGEYDYSGKYEDTFTTLNVPVTAGDKEINPPDDYLPTDENSNGLSDLNDYKFIYWYIKRGNEKIKVEFPINVSNAYETTYYAFYIDINKGSDELVYKKTTDACIVSGYSGEGGVVVIPEKTLIDGILYDVSGIGDGVFKSVSVDEFVVSRNNKYFKVEDGILYNKEGTVLYAYPSGNKNQDITISLTTEEISPYAFYNAVNLVNINLNENLKYILDYAFRDCVSLQSITIPKNVISIGEGAFKMNSDSALESINFAGTEILSIGDEAFYGLNSLKSFVLPASLSSIGDGAFYGCSGLETIDASRNSYFNEYNGALYSIDYETLYVYPAKKSDNDNPEVIIHRDCKKIARGAFYFSNISCITINSNLELETYSIVCPALRSIRVNYPGFVYNSDTFLQAFAEYTPESIYVIKGNSSFENIQIEGTEIYFYNDWNGLSNYYEGFAYSLSDTEDGISIDGYNGIYSALSIPSMISGIPVVEISADAFNGNAQIVSVEIPIEVIKIGERAFMNCKSLSSVTILSDTESGFEIGTRAFYGCSSLTEVNIRDDLNITDFGDYVFDETPIAEGDNDFVIIGGVLVSYQGNNLTVEIPANVKYIATDAFKDCGFITEISFESGSSLEVIDEYAFLNCSGIKQIILPSKLKKVNNYAFYGCDYLFYVKYSASSESVEIGSEAYYQAGNFYGTEVNVEFVDTQYGSIYYHVGTAQTVVNGVAFVEPMSPEITPSELFIGWYYESTYTTRADFPLSLGEGERLDLYALIKENSYVSDGLVYSKNDDGTYTIIGYVGTDNHLVIGKTHMGAEVTGIGENAFGETVVEITIPNEINPNTSQYVSNILTVGIDAFIKTEWYRNMSGDFVIYDNLLLAYKGNAKVVIVPDSVSVIAEGLFKNNKSIEYVKLPTSVRSLPAEIFSGCTNLKQVELGNEVAQIGEKAFYDCTSLEKINFDTTSALTLIAPDALDNTSWLKNYSEDCVIINGILYKYYGSAETLHIPSGVTSIAENAFTGNTDIVNLHLPASLVTIRENAFENAISLVQVYIPSGTSSLGYIMKGAFKNCYNLSKIDFSMITSLTEIGDEAFENCSALKNLFIPENLTYLGENSFKSSGLETVTAADGTRLGEIGAGAFNNCRSLKSVVFEGESALHTVGNSAFRDCTSLETFSNPYAPLAVFEDYSLYNCINLSKFYINENALTEIGKDAVYRLGYISSQNKNMIMLGNILVSYSGTDKIVEIPANVTLIYDSAFEGNTNIIEIVFAEGSTLKKINDRAFFGCSSLEIIDFPLTVETVGYKIAEGTIWYTEQLNKNEYIIINNTLVKYNIDSTRQADIPEQVTKIIKGAFEERSVYDIKVGANVIEIQEGAFEGIIPAEWEESGQSIVGWTMTIENTEPFTLGYETQIPGCIAIYMPDETTYEKYTLDAEWGYQSDIIKMITKYSINYSVVSGEAEKIESETVHALYNAKEVIPYQTTSKQYVFVGWFKDANYYEAITYPFILTEDTTVYAKCVDYDEGSNPEDYILQEIEGSNQYTILNYLDETDKSVVIITKHSNLDIYSITGYLGYIPYSGTEYERFVYNSEEGIFEPYDVYGNYPEGTETYRQNTVIEELSFANNCTIEVLGDNCFAGMVNLQKITLPSSLKYISSEAFSSCKNLREIVFSDGMDGLVIEEGAFRDCTALETIRIPDGVTTLEDGAFAGCIKLKDIYLESETPIVLYQGAMPFEIVASMKIYVPYGRKAVYSSSWMNYYDYLVEMEETENADE